MVSAHLLLAQLQPVPGTIFTNGLAVAVIALLHIQIAAYLTGSSTLAIVSESISMARGDERHSRLSHMLLKSWVYTFGFGSATAIFFVLFILTGLWAIFYIALQQVTFWVFLFEAATFIAEIVLLYSLYANWDRLRCHRRARLGMLVLLNIALWWQMFLIDVIATFMLTPNGGDANLLDQFLNPTALPLTLHRTVGNVAWAGAVVGFIGAFNYLRLTRRARVPALEAGSRAQPVPALRSVGAMAAGHLDEQRRREEVLHWEWVAQWGLIWAVGVTLLQPWLGYSYAKEIQLHAYGAWYTMMFGDISNVFLVQIFLLGSIFTIGSVYAWRRMVHSGAPGQRRQLACVVALVLCVLLAVQPAWFARTYSDAIAAAGDRPWWQGGLLNPIGNFIPYKAGALIGMVLFGLVSLTLYLVAISRDQIRPGSATRRTNWLVIALGVTISVMMIVMGVIREHPRQPYLINGEITLHQQITNNQPSINSLQQGQP